MPGAGGYNDSGTVFIKDNIGYDISLKGINLSSSKQAYEQILSTFKFTD